MILTVRSTQDQFSWFTNNKPSKGSYHWSKVVLNSILFCALISSYHPPPSLLYSFTVSFLFSSFFYRHSFIVFALNKEVYEFAFVFHIQKHLKSKQSNTSLSLSLGFQNFEDNKELYFSNLGKVWHAIE